jgi:hypothetical protein
MLLYAHQNGVQLACLLSPKINLELHPPPFVAIVLYKQQLKFLPPHHHFSRTPKQALCNLQLSNGPSNVLRNGWWLRALSVRMTSVSVPWSVQPIVLTHPVSQIFVYVVPTCLR